MSKLFYKALGVTETWPKLSLVHPSSITYADVILLQQISKVASRSELNITTKFGPYTLQVPVITAPMDTISGEKMIREMHTLGGLGTLPRIEMKEAAAICKRLSNDKVPCMYSVGLHTALEDARLLKENGAQLILLDVANGAMERVIKT